MSTKSARQITQSCVHIWELLDIDMRVIPKNSLADPELLEDYFYHPKVQQLISQRKKANGKEKKSVIEAQTISSKLGALRKLFNFSKTRQVFFGVNFQEIDVMILKIQELTTGLKPLILERYTVFYITNDPIHE